MFFWPRPALLDLKGSGKVSRGKLCKDCVAKRSGLYECPLDAL